MLLAFSGIFSSHFHNDTKNVRFIPPKIRVLDFDLKIRVFNSPEVLYVVVLGNGVLCMDMEQEGFTDITGIDYCQEAIDLAEKVRILLYRSL